ncbi:hypothetical protein [Lysobacter sp. N42]|jgi:hypothetical protein|nr:hypothetical protein [Lysobacter sp. N42]
MLRAIVKLVATYAITRALTRAGGPRGVLNSVLSSRPKGKRGRR